MIKRVPRLKKRPSKVWLIAAVVAGLIAIVGIVAVRDWYNRNLEPVNHSSSETRYFTVASGSSVHKIAVDLEWAKLIRNAKAFETYVRSKEYNDKLQAGTYVLGPSMNVSQIVNKMVEGEVAKNLFTILPGKTLDEIKQAFLHEGYSKGQVEEAFKPANYAGHPALASLPRGATLEGYLYPDSFQKLADTPPRQIIRASLDEMNKYLTPDITTAFAKRGLSIYRAIILASIVYQETDDPEAQPTVAQVFYKRLSQGIKLESDATTSRFNTYENEGLPPKPLSNVTDSSLKAVANPAKTDYLFFVAGDDDVIHFSKTKAEHEAAVARYCTQKCR
ncbi:MAG: endolytic transglycosylase MltG [Candidatus Saccharimonadales bacterium]